MKRINEIETTQRLAEFEKENYEKALNKKKSLRNEHQNESKKLESDKKKKEIYLSKIKKEKSNLEKIIQKQNLS